MRQFPLLPRPNRGQKLCISLLKGSQKLRAQAGGLRRELFGFLNADDESVWQTGAAQAVGVAAPTLVAEPGAMHRIIVQILIVGPTTAFYKPAIALPLVN